MQGTVHNFRVFIRLRRILSIFGVLLYPVVLWGLRPSYTGSSPIILTILGSLPHLLAGFLLPLSALKPELILQHPKAYHQVFVFICAGVIGWLTLEEFVPIFSPTGEFDPFDVAFGVIGCGIAFWMYVRIFRPLATVTKSNF